MYAYPAAGDGTLIVRIAELSCGGVGEEDGIGNILIGVCSVGCNIRFLFGRRYGTMIYLDGDFIQMIMKRGIKNGKRESETQSATVKQTNQRSVYIKTACPLTVLPPGQSGRSPSPTAPAAAPPSPSSASRSSSTAASPSSTPDGG